MALRAFNSGDRVVHDIRDNPKITRPRPKGQRPSILPNRPTGSTIQSGQFSVGMSVEIVLIVRNKFCYGLCRVIINHQGDPLGADHMVRRQRASCCNTGHVISLGKTMTLRTAVESGQHRAVRCSTDFITDRGQFKFRCACLTGCGAWGHPQRLFGLGDEINHARVTFPGIVRETEDPVIHQNHTLQRRPVDVLCHLRHFFSQHKPRHDIRHHQQAVAV